MNSKIDNTKKFKLIHDSIILGIIPDNIKYQKKIYNVKDKIDNAIKNLNIDVNIPE